MVTPIPFLVLGILCLGTDRLAASYQSATGYLNADSFLAGRGSIIYGKHNRQGLRAGVTPGGKPLKCPDLGVFG